MKFHTVTINSDDHEIRLDRYFKRYHQNTSFAVIAKLVRKKLIKINGKKADISTKLKEGDTLTYPTLQESTLSAERFKAQDKYINMIKDCVIFKDENIIVLNKPYGLAVQGGSKIKISVDELSVHLQDNFEEKPKLVHRIDKDTTGLLVLARKSNIAAHLSELIRRKEFYKTYLAICLNVPKPMEGKINLPIMKSVDTQQNFEKVKPDVKGKNALTYYSVLDYAANKYSLVEAKIITGRTHQIRVHLSSINCPIIGDDKYGMHTEISESVADKLYLHAYKLEFELKGKKYKFNAPLPIYFKEALNNLGLNVNFN